MILVTFCTTSANSALDHHFGCWIFVVFVRVVPLLQHHPQNKPCMLLLTTDKIEHFSCLRLQTFRPLFSVCSNVNVCQT